MKIIIDSREKRMLSFSCETIIKCLPVGDYGCSFYEGHLHPVILERKSIPDLYGSLTQNYDRFKKMFKRAEEKGIKVIICIEGTKEKVLEGYDHSARDPASIIKQLETIERKYNVEHKFFKTRHQMSAYIEQYFKDMASKYGNPI